MCFFFHFNYSSLDSANLVLEIYMTFFFWFTHKINLKYNLIHLDILYFSVETTTTHLLTLFYYSTSDLFFYFLFIIFYYCTILVKAIPLVLPSWWVSEVSGALWLLHHVPKTQLRWAIFFLLACCFFLSFFFFLNF